MINSIYKELIKPENIRSFFKTNEEFESWLDTGSNEDLKHTLKAFEDAEMYEDCVIIKNKINDNNRPFTSCFL